MSPLRAAFVESAVVTPSLSHDGNPRSFEDIERILTRHSAHSVSNVRIPTLACARFLRCCRNLRVLTIETTPVRVGRQLNAFPCLERLAFVKGTPHLCNMSMRPLSRLRALALSADMSVESLELATARAPTIRSADDVDGDGCDLRGVANPDAPAHGPDLKPLDESESRAPVLATPAVAHNLLRLGSRSATR